MKINFDDYPWGEWIAVDDNGEVFIYDKKPCKDMDEWICDTYDNPARQVGSFENFHHNITTCAVPVKGLTGEWVVNDGLRNDTFGTDYVTAEGEFVQDIDGHSLRLGGQYGAKNRVALYRPVAKPATDPVNHPSHYKQGGIECIDAIEAALTTEEFAGYCKGNAIKYVWRANHKGNASQDMAKARWYLGRLSGD